MKLRVTVARLLLPPMLALGATAGALAADSPFAVFKKIVLLSESEREAAVGKLKISSERHRKLVQAKVREYAAMPEAERDRKLDALDFRWHLMPIMKTAKTDRAKQLASVPERLRTDIERRLTAGTSWRPASAPTCSRTSRFSATSPASAGAASRALR